VGSKVERVKRRRVMNRKRAQMEMVDWALEIIALEVVLLLLLLDFNEEGEEEIDGGCGEDEDGEEEEEEEEEGEKSLFLSTMGWLSSFGKKTRSKPMLLFVLALAFGESPIFVFSLLLLNLPPRAVPIERCRELLLSSTSFLAISEIKFILVRVLYLRGSIVLLLNIRHIIS
jgi:hypothetical protein